jgi:hypothetical protein
MVLGLRPNIECDSATELTIETQLSDPSNPRQQFEVTRDGRIVSVACPAKVMTTVLALDGLCDSGIALSISTANFETNDESLLQQWTVNSEQGVITNAKCPNLAISSNKEKDVHMNSIYFALQNPRTQLAIGITGTLDDTCTNGMALEMQDMMYGAPNQQFIYDEADLTIANLMCPGYFISIQDGDCSGVDGLYLSSDEYTDKRNKWAFDGNVIQSIKCQDKFITISGALGGRMRAADLTSKKTTSSHTKRHELVKSQVETLSEMYTTLGTPNETQLQPSDGATDDNIGYSVAIDGNIAIVGANLDDDKGTNSGSAFVFELENGNWVQKAKLTANDVAVNDYFGSSVAISGNTAIIGAWADDDKGNLSGSAFVFERDEDTGN